MNTDRLREQCGLAVTVSWSGPAGFGTAASLRQHLNNTLGVTPYTYRRTFRSTDGVPFSVRSAGPDPVSTG